MLFRSKEKNESIIYFFFNGPCCPCQDHLPVLKNTWLVLSSSSMVISKVIKETNLCCRNCCYVWNGIDLCHGVVLQDHSNKSNAKRGTFRHSRSNPSFCTVQFLFVLTTKKLCHLWQHNLIGQSVM